MADHSLLDSSFMDFQIWDIPGQLDYLSPTATPGTPLSPSSDPANPALDPSSVFSTFGALIWVIDAQDDYTPSLMRLINTTLHLQVTHPNVNIEVLVHKTDGLSDEYKSDAFHAISQRIEDELADAGYGLGEGGGVDQMPRIHYHLTSIYDYSIFEAFSKIIQRLIPQLGTLENLLNILVNNTGMEKAYLFDILSKIYVASDTRPGGGDLYELGSDFVDVIVDTSELYSWVREDDASPTTPRSQSMSVPPTPTTMAESESEGNEIKPPQAQGQRIMGSQCVEAESHCHIQDGSMTYMMEMNRCVFLPLPQPFITPFCLFISPQLILPLSPC